jgi:hypothetical protein
MEKIRKQRRRKVSIKDKLTDLTGRELPVSGGHGTSMDDAIVIELPYEEMNMPIERRIVQALFPGYVIEQQTLKQNGFRMLDEFVLVKGGIFVEGPREYLYFDISHSFGYFSGPVYFDKNGNVVGTKI